MTTTTTTIAERLAALSPEQRDALRRRLVVPARANDESIQVIERDGKQPLPMSFAQQRLWFLEQLAPGNPTYTMSGAARIFGPLNLEAWRRSLSEVVARHEALRTTFAVVDGQPQAVVAIRQDVEPRVLDMRETDVGKRAELAQRLMLEEVRKPFDLAGGPLLRALVIELADDERLILLAMHHIVSDGWSTGLLFRELGALYRANADGGPAPLAPLRIQYADFAAWQRDWLSGERLERLLAYWRTRLAACPPALQVPSDRPRGPSRDYHGARHPVQLSPKLTEQLRTFARTEGATPFMVLLAGFKALLQRYTGQEDVVVGSPIAGRPRPETEALIGLFVNTLVLRTDLSGDPTFREALARVRETALGAYAHQELPFEKLVEELQPERDLAHTPFFQVMFGMQADPTRSLSLPGLTLEEIDAGTAKFDLTFNLTDKDEYVDGYVEYDTDLFEANTIGRLLGHFESLLVGALAEPDGHLSKLPLLTNGERDQIRAWNATSRGYPLGRCLHGLVEEQAARTPEGLALVFEGRNLTFHELNQRANQLARQLQSLGVGKDDLVAVCCERSPELIVALLGILKAGGAYLPLDSSYPRERLAFMLEDAAPKVVLTQRKLAGDLPAASGRLVVLDSDVAQASIAAQSREAPSSDVSQDNLAYVIYTSGTTGRPKGVMISHKAIVNRMLWGQETYPLTAYDRVLHKTPISFDVSIEELFWPLMCGATMVIARPGGQQDPGYLADLIAEQHVTVAHFVPSAMRVFLEVPDLEHRTASLRLLFSSGEAMTAELAERARKRLGAEYHNIYGPTETTVECSFLPADAPVDGPILPIGLPAANTQHYVLDRRLQLLPVGVPGELFIGGVQVARGYLGRPELTAEKFIADPFGDDPTNRLYASGDLVRQRSDGICEFLGRLDHQVKIRGFRVELGEVEAALEQHPSIRETVVIARADADGDTRLIAYVVSSPDESPTPQALREFLSLSLPDYMLPASIVHLDALPLTANGKLDRAALPSPERTRPDVGQEYVRPSTPTQQLLAATWSDMLGVPRVGIDDNFFDLGGHSLLAARLMFRLRAALELELPLKLLFASPTVAGMARAIDAIRAHGLAAALSELGALDLPAEVVLDPAITGEGMSPPERIGDPNRVFLTGATGFLGSFLLKALLDRTHADVYCLVRAASPAAGAERIRAAMTSYGIWNQAQSGRVIPIVGDLSKPLLGLGLEQFDHLAGAADVIYHCGATVNFLRPYATLKAPNVLGTQEVLRMACRTRLKPVHYVSSFYVFSRFEYVEGQILREEDIPKHDLTFTVGYTQTKWVAEQMVMLARARGIPVSIYRPGRVSGDSHTGACQTHDFMWQSIKAGIDIGYGPDLNMLLDMAPVDFVSQAIVHLSGQTRSLGKAFHLVNPHSIKMSDLASWLQAYGYAAEFVPYPEWRQALMSLAEREPDGPAAPLMPIISGGVPIDQLPTVEFDCRNVTEGLAGSGLSCPRIDGELLNTYFTYFIRSGYLREPSVDTVALAYA